MKNIYKLSLLGLLIVVVIAVNTQYVYAQNVDNEQNTGIENRILEELSTYADEHNIPVCFENISCTIDYEYFHEIDEADAFVEEKIQLIKNELDNISICFESSQVQTRTITDNGSYYTAKVESMVPAIGWGYICQDFKATISSGIISSITLQGDSYDTGFTIGSWEPNYSWTEISTNKRYCQIYMKGTVNYLWEGLNLSMDATFKATGKGNGSKIEEAYTGDWPG